MTPTKTPQTDASDHIAAVARWDDDGGAFESSSRKTGAEGIREPRAPEAGAKQEDE
jgi:hypothetical protein